MIFRIALCGRVTRIGEDERVRDVPLEAKVIWPPEKVAPWL
jgi:hypothetical protein